MINDYINKIKDTYAKYEKLSKTYIFNVSKKHMDEMLDNTINMLKKEEFKYKNKQGIYNDKILLTDTIRNDKFKCSITDIVNNYTKQMYQYTNENYIIEMFDSDSYSDENTDEYVDEDVVTQKNEKPFKILQKPSPTKVGKRRANLTTVKKGGGIFMVGGDDKELQMIFSQ